MSTSISDYTDVNALSLFDLSDRVALVTGGGTGLGLMIARGLASNGAKVYIGGRKEDVLTASAVEYKWQGKIIPLPMDVTDKAEILAAKETIARTDGYLDTLVNNAGQVGPCSPWMSDASAHQNTGDAEAFGMALFSEGHDDWAHIFAINAYSPFFVTSAFMGLLAEGAERHGAWTANVINLTSMSASIKVAQDHFAYNSAKAANTHLTKMLATELARRKIPVRVNALAPGVFESEMTRELLQEKGVHGVAQGMQPVPMGRVGSVNEMAGTALWMASPAGGYLNGQEILIDGGFTTVNPSRY
ncbi:NAD(P)-binding protein [Schizophyllum commune Tattone D]|nr:NAD(P)-binding protein [Schizophyllum commune Tattone D]